MTDEQTSIDSYPKPSATEMWFAAQLMELRRCESELRSILLALADAADDVGRLCDDKDAEHLFPNWRLGLNVLRAKLLQTLSAHGVVPIPTAGERLDLKHHHVVEVSSDPGEPETVLRQLRPGYLWKGQVLRTAHVVTARNPQ